MKTFTSSFYSHISDWWDRWCSGAVRGTPLLPLSQTDILENSHTATQASTLWPLVAFYLAHSDLWRGSVEKKHVHVLCQRCNPEEFDLWHRLLVQSGDNDLIQVANLSDPQIISYVEILILNNIVSSMETYRPLSWLNIRQMRQYKWGMMHREIAILFASRNFSDPQPLWGRCEAGLFMSLFGSHARILGLSQHCLRSLQSCLHSYMYNFLLRL